MQLPPVLCLTLLRGQDLHMRELLRMVVLDLSLREVILVSPPKAVHDPLGERESEYLVRLGPKGIQYVPALWETPFLRHFHYDTECVITLRNYAKLLYAKTPYASQILSQIIRHPQYKRYFKQGLWAKVFGGFKLSDDGRQLMQAMQAELDAAAALLDDSKANAVQTGAYLSSLGAHALLLRSLPQKYLSTWMLELIDSPETTTPEKEALHAAMDWGLWIAVASSTEFAYQSHQAKSGSGGDAGGYGGSGCGGNSGCGTGCGGGSGCGSGCSGCGGCGGCGG
jgi:hypothetical protein